MAAGLPWTFTQIDGTRAPMTLDGWQAPFGRARSSSLVNGGLSMRHQVTYYAGSNVPPTVHSFGRRWRSGRPY